MNTQKQITDDEIEMNNEGEKITSTDNRNLSNEV